MAPLSLQNIVLHSSDIRELEMCFPAPLNVLCAISNVYVSVSLQKGLLEVLYEIFRLPVPIVTQDFTEALLSVGE